MKDIEFKTDNRSRKAMAYTLWKWASQPVKTEILAWLVLQWMAHPRNDYDGD